MKYEWFVFRRFEYRFVVTTHLYVTVKIKTEIDDCAPDMAPMRSFPSFIESSFTSKVEYEAWIKALDGGPDTNADEDDPLPGLVTPIYVRSREGDLVPWSREAAQRADELKCMMDYYDAGDGTYPVDLPATVLRTVAVLLEPDVPVGTLNALVKMSLNALGGLAEAAVFLEATPALEHDQREVAARLDGGSTDEMRALLGATDDFDSDEAREVLTAEPAFMPPEQIALPPAVQPQPSLSGLSITRDASEKALEKVETGTLLKLKGVNRSWCGVAQRLLCSSICCDEDGSIRTLADITDVDAECLARGGRAGDVSAAGRLLPNLVRLRGFGFEVDVAAIRGRDLSAALADEDEDDVLGGVLGGYITRLAPDEGPQPAEVKPPLELHLMAIACAASGEICRVPVQRLREDDAIGELDLGYRSLGPMAAKLLGRLLPRAASVV